MNYLVSAGPIHTWHHAILVVFGVVLILLLLYQIVLLDLFLEFDVFFVNAVDLLPQVLMLPLQSLDQLVFVVDFREFLAVKVGLDLDLVS